MAIIIVNKSKCAICGKIIATDDEVIGFPPFIDKESDPLFFFNDRGFHKACFFDHPLKSQVIKRLDKLTNT